eukprot:Gb_15701 [translate_table: standard]
MASKATTELLAIFKLQFTNTHFGRELLGDKILNNYNDIYCVVEDVDILFAEEEEHLEDDARYKSDLMTLKAAGLQKIAAKPKVFPCKDLFSRAMKLCTLEQGLLVSPAGAVAILSGSVFWDLYKTPRSDMVYNTNATKAFLKGKDIVKTILKGWAERPETFKKKANLDHPISHFRRGKPDLLEVLTFNIHTNWEVAKPGRDFFMASYIVDACCAYLDFNHPIFLALPHPSNAPIHVLFGICVQVLQLYCPNLHPLLPPIYKVITGADMPKMATTVRLDLELIGAWLYFEKSTIIGVEGILTPPIELPLYVPDRLVALEEVETEETDELIKQKLLRGLPIGTLEVQLPATTTSTTISSTTSPFTSLDPSSGSANPLSVEPSVATTPVTSLHENTPPSPTITTSSTITLPFTSFSQNTPLTIEVSPLISLKPNLWGSPTFTFRTPPLPLTTPPTISQATFDTLVSLSVSTSAFTLPTTPWEYRLTMLLSTTKAFATLGFSNLVFTTKESTMAPAIESLTPSSTITTSTMLSTPGSPMSLQMDTTTPRHLEVTLEYDKATSSLKRVTKRKIKTGEQVTTLQIEENLLSLTRKRKRGTKGEEVVERMQMELAQAHNKIVISPSMSIEIQGSLKDLFKSLAQVEEAKSIGKQVHHEIQGTLRQIGEREAKLATLGNIARRNLLPNVPLLSLDEVSPGIILPKHPIIACQCRVPPVIKQDNTLCMEVEFEATLGDFVNKCSGHLVSVEEQGKQSIHEFAIGVARKIERVQCVKEFLNPILTEHTKTMSKVASRIKDPIVNTARIDDDYDNVHKPWEMLAPSHLPSCQPTQEFCRRPWGMKILLRIGIGIVVLELSSSEDCAVLVFCSSGHLVSHTYVNHEILNPWNRGHLCMAIYKDRECLVEVSIGRSRTIDAEGGVGAIVPMKRSHGTWNNWHHCNAEGDLDCCRCTSRESSAIEWEKVCGVVEGEWHSESWMPVDLRNAAKACWELGTEHNCMRDFE